MRKRAHLLIISTLTFALIACSADNQSPPSHDAHSATSATATANAPSIASSCPTQDFDKFLSAFMSDLQVQKAQTALPLQSEAVDPNAEPEPKPVTKMLTEAELKFPLMPPPQQQAQDGLQLSKTITDSTHIEVKLAKPDTDYQLIFFFQNEGCWKLYRIRNDSL